MIDGELLKSLRRAPAGGLHGYRGGQFLPAQIWESEKRAAEEALPARLLAFGDDLQALRELYEQNSALIREGVTRVKLIPLSTVAARMKTTVRRAYDDLFLLGKRASGNLRSMTEQDRRAVKALRIDEYRYLRRFLADMHGQTGVIDYASRMDYYRAAGREVFWLGWLLGDQSLERRIAWDLGPTEHCGDCLRIANGNPYTVADFIAKVLPYLPNSGRLECLGYNCRCRLVEVKS